jgi:hypothetical protein
MVHHPEGLGKEKPRLIIVVGSREDSETELGSMYRQFNKEETMWFWRRLIRVLIPVPQFTNCRIQSK